MSDDLTIEKVMSRTPKAFRPEKAEGVEAVVQFHFTGKEASNWVVKIEDGECMVEEGEAEEPRMTMTIDSQDYIDILTGKLDGMKAFMQGKVKVKGDMGLAMKFPNYFSTP